MAGHPRRPRRGHQAHRVAAPQREPARRRHRGRVAAPPRQARRARDLRRAVDAEHGELRLLHRPRGVPPARQRRGARGLRRGAAQLAPRPGPGHPVARLVPVPDGGRVHDDGGGGDYHFNCGCYDYPVWLGNKFEFIFGHLPDNVYL